MIKKYLEDIDTVFTLAITEFKLNVNESFLGILWHILNPILLFLFLYLIFFDRLGLNIQNYPIYLFIGLTLFNFFQYSTIESINAFTYNNTLIKAINFNFEKKIAAIVLKNLFFHIIDFIILVIILVITKSLSINILFYIPILLIFILFIYGTCLLLSAGSFIFRDLYFIWAFLIKILFFLTPIFYDIGGQHKLFLLNLFNPLFYFINLYRSILINISKIDYSYLFISILFSFVVFGTGKLIFILYSKKITELS